MGWFGVLPDLCKELYGLSDGVFDEGIVKVGYFHGGGYEYDESLEIVDEYTCLFFPGDNKVVIYFGPIVSIDMQEI